MVQITNKGRGKMDTGENTIEECIICKAMSSKNKKAMEDLPPGEILEHLKKGHGKICTMVTNGYHEIAKIELGFKWRRKIVGMTYFKLDEKGKGFWVQLEGKTKLITHDRVVDPIFLFFPD